MVFGVKFSKLCLSCCLVLVLALPACERSSTRTTTIITNSATKYIVASKNGLALSIGLESTNYHPGDTISIKIDEINTLAKDNLVQGADLWADQNLTLGGCGVEFYPFGLSILAGYYDESNYSSAAPLVSLYELDAIYQCPAEVGINSYDFEPSSNVAIVMSPGADNSSPINMTHTNTVTGFWMGTWFHATYSDFTPGIYTIVGGDMWGAIAILHFTVS